MFYNYSNLDKSSMHSDYDLMWWSMSDWSYEVFDTASYYVSQMALYGEILDAFGDYDGRYGEIME